LKLVSKIVSTLALAFCSVVSPAFGAGLLVPVGAVDEAGLQIKSHDISVAVEKNAERLELLTKVYPQNYSVVNMQIEHYIEARRP